MFDLIAQVINPQSVPACVAPAPCPVGNEPQVFKIPAEDRGFIVLPANASAAELKATAERIKAYGWAWVVFSPINDRKHPVASVSPSSWVKKLIDLPVGDYVLTEF